MKNLLCCISLLAALFAASGIAAAQDVDPSSRVARIAFMAGPVSFEPASVDAWADASLNYPMSTGDNLYTDDGARAVLRIGQNAIRLNSDTNFQFVNLSDNVVQTSVNAGSLSLRVRHLFDGESWEVDTPNGAITLLRRGEYRVDTDASRNATMVTVREGDIEVTAGDQSFPVHSGQTAYFDNSGNNPDVEDANQPDDFDSFVSMRDRIEDVPPPRYVSPNMVGYEDLNGNGDWHNSAEYGPVWTPRVAAGWTPYHDGHWAWVDPWGWTWVDSESWGFAPFHYGRWAYVNNSWSWCPGEVTERVYYAPALVAFVGGGGFSAGVSIGGGGLVGWFPLGPREAYYPSYHVSEDYVRRVNVTNTRVTNLSITNINVTNVNVTNITYANRNAMVAMPQNSFASAQSVQHAGVRVDATQIRDAQVVGAAPKVAPQRESVLANTSGRAAAAPPTAIANRPVVAKLAPPQAAVPFAARQQMLQAHPGTPIAPAQLQTLRSEPAGQNPAPGRGQVQRINTQQVHAVTPTVRPGAAPTFAQRPAEPRPGLAKPASENPRNEPAVAARPQNPAAVHEQVQSPIREQIQPPVRPEPPVSDRVQLPVREQVQPPVRPEPTVREPVQPLVRPAPPTEREARPAPPVHTEAPPQPKTPPPAHKPPPPKVEEKKPEDK